MSTPVGESDPEDMTPEVELELAPLPPALALALGSVPDPEGLPSPFSASKASLAVFTAAAATLPVQRQQSFKNRKKLRKKMVKLIRRFWYLRKRFFLEILTP